MKNKFILIPSGEKNRTNDISDKNIILPPVAQIFHCLKRKDNRTKPDYEHSFNTSTGLGGECHPKHSSMV